MFHRTAINVSGASSTPSENKQDKSKLISVDTLMLDTDLYKKVIESLARLGGVEFHSRVSLNRTIIRTDAIDPKKSIALVYMIQSFVIAKIINVRFEKDLALGENRICFIIETLNPHSIIQCYEGGLVCSEDFQKLAEQSKTTISLFQAAFKDNPIIDHLFCVIPNALGSVSRKFPHIRTVFLPYQDRVMEEYNILSELSKKTGFFSLDYKEMEDFSLQAMDNVSVKPADLKGTKTSDLPATKFIQFILDVNGSYEPLWDFLKSHNPVSQVVSTEHKETKKVKTPKLFFHHHPKPEGFYPLKKKEDMDALQKELSLLKDYATIGTTSKLVGKTIDEMLKQNYISITQYDILKEYSIHSNYHIHGLIISTIRKVVALFDMSKPYSTLIDLQNRPTVEPEAQTKVVAEGKP